MQRVVSRSELVSDGSEVSDSTSEHAIDAALNNLDQFEFVQAKSGCSNKDNDNVNEDDGLDFRLFAAPPATGDRVESKQPHKIKLRSPSIDRANPGFVQPNRNLSYYFAKALSSTDKENLESSAISGEQVLNLSRSYRPGIAYSWKVLNLSTSNLAKPLRTNNQSTFARLVPEDRSQRKTRPGKKSRIKLRSKSEKAKQKQLATKAATKAKDAAQKEKRTQRNREKKVKKRLRDKAKKESTAEAATILPPDD